MTIANEKAPVTTFGCTRVKAEQFFKTRLCPLLGAQKPCPHGSSCSYAHSEEELRPTPNLTKTRLCEAYQQTGKCALGVNCSFAHGREELKHTEELFKTRLCHFWSKGECRYGNYCRHAHGYYELRQRPVFQENIVVPSKAELSSVKERRASDVPQTDVSTDDDGGTPDNRRDSDDSRVGLRSRVQSECLPTPVAARDAGRAADTPARTARAGGRRRRNAPSFDISRPSTIVRQRFMTIGSLPEMGSYPSNGFSVDPSPMSFWGPSGRPRAMSSDGCGSAWDPQVMAGRRTAMSFDGVGMMEDGVYPFYGHIIPMVPAYHPTQPAGPPGNAVAVCAYMAQSIPENELRRMSFDAQYDD